MDTLRDEFIGLSHSVCPLQGIAVAKFISKMSVSRGKMFYPKPVGVYSRRGWAGGAKEFSPMYFINNALHYITL